MAIHSKALQTPHEVNSRAVKSNIIHLFPGARRQRVARLWEEIEPVMLHVNTGEGIAEYRASLKHFTREQRLAHAVLAYLTETCDGGHHGFFYNSAGILWEEAMRGLREIGASENALILSAAALRAGGIPPERREERRRMLVRLSPRFDDLDAAFQKSDPTVALDEYFKVNRAAFYFTRSPN